MSMLLYLLKLIFTEPLQNFCRVYDNINLLILIALILKRRKNDDSCSLPNLYKSLVHYRKKHD